MSSETTNKKWDIRFVSGPDYKTQGGHTMIQTKINRLLNEGFKIIGYSFFRGNHVMMMKEITEESK